MRFKLLIAVLAFCLAPSALAQSKPIYFLVDASGSMQGQNQADAELLLRALSLPRGQLVSVVYFGSKPATPGTNLCFETLSISKPTPRGDNFVPELVNLGGRDDQTAIANAIEKVLEEAVRPAKLIVITDGEEDCNRHFADIRQRHHDVEIEIRQVGDSPNPELQKLEERSSPVPVTAPTSPLINLELQTEPSNSGPNLWGLADWFERRLWLLASAALIAGAWFWGSRFGRMANKFENETKAVELKRREMLEKGETSAAEIGEALTDELEEKTVRLEGHADAWRFAFTATVAAVLVVPLVLFEFTYPQLAAWISSFIVAVALLSLLALVVKKTWPTSPKEERSLATFAPTAATLMLGIAATGFCVWSCWVDPTKAQGAAWFVLSADFSAALAVSASAPMLFVGSQWWRFETAKTTYQQTYTEAITDSLREKRRAEKRTKDQWNNFTSMHLSWRPALEYSPLGRRFWQELWLGNANKARETVVEKIRSLSLAVGGGAASNEGNVELGKLLEARLVEKRIHLLLANKVTQEKMVPADEWLALAKALESKKDRLIAEAYVKLARSLNRSDAQTS